MSTQETTTREETPSRRGPQPRRKVVQMVVVGVIASAAGIALGLSIHWFPPADSTQADKIDTLWDVLIIASVPIFVLVMTVVLFSVLNFRMRPGEEDLDGPPIHGNTRLEVVWTALPAMLIVGLVTYAYIVLTNVEKAPASGHERVVGVTGQQFAWTFQYNENGKRFSTTQLYIPAGQSVKFNIRTKDVIHDFWVPDFRMKLDAVPGLTGNYRITPKNPQAIGSHPIVCAELCGIGHAFMRSTVHVLAPAQFAAWVRRMTSAQAAASPAGGAAAINAGQLFASGNPSTGATACGSCHTLAEARTAGTVGPDLDKVLKGKSAAFIRQSIVDPNAVIAPGYQANIMPPNFRATLSAAQINALVAFLAKAANK
jgi:cytochrome c oxidase subunit 2